MVKPEWGIKRTCNGCGVRFYDLNNTQIVCPKCSAPYEMITTSRRKRGAAVDSGKLAVIDDLALVDGIDLPDIDADVVDDLIEDTDDLDADLDDMGNVIDHSLDDEL